MPVPKAICLGALKECFFSFLAQSWFSISPSMIYLAFCFLPSILSSLCLSNLNLLQIQWEAVCVHGIELQVFKQICIKLMHLKNVQLLWKFFFASFLFLVLSARNKCKFGSQRTKCFHLSVNETAVFSGQCLQTCKNPPEKLSAAACWVILYLD